MSSWKLANAGGEKHPRGLALIDAVVIDTDVLSYLFKGDTRAGLYLPHLDQRLGLLCFMTLAELRQWALIRNWGERRRRNLEEFISRT